MEGACAFLILPAADAECFQIFLDSLGKRFSRWHILLVLDGAPHHISGDLVIPANITVTNPRQSRGPSDLSRSKRLFGGRLRSPPINSRCDLHRQADWVFE
jgi:hypothetical protein